MTGTIAPRRAPRRGSISRSADKSTWNLYAVRAHVANMTTAESLPPVVILWLLPVPILELFTSTFRRALTGLSPMRADRGHFHYRLLDAGFSVRSVFILYICTSTISAIVGLRAWVLGVPESWLFYAFLAFAVVWLVCIANATRIAAHLPESLKRGSLPPLLRRRPRDSTGSASIKR